MHSTTACRWSRASTAPRSSSTFRTSRCSGPPSGWRWASRALAAGLPYVGADFRFDPPHYASWERPPSRLAVIGTGKRVGKTAVAGHLARLLARDREVRRRRDGPGRSARAGAHRVASVGGRPRRALAGRTARGLRPPRDRRALRRADDRLPAGGRRSRRAGVRLERPRRRVASRRTEPRRGCLRLERHGDPAGRGRPARARGRAGARSRRALQSSILPAESPTWCVVRATPSSRGRVRRDDSAPPRSSRSKGASQYSPRAGWTSAGSARRSFTSPATSATVLHWPRISLVWMRIRISWRPQRRRDRRRRRARPYA